MVILYKYIPAWDMADLSPFCLKAETYLRMVGVPFEGRVADVRKAPKKKLPYIDDGGTLVCDSRDIIEHFEQKLPNALDRELSPQQRALTVAYRALLEEEAYFYAMVLRWTLDDGWAIYRPVMERYLSAIGVPSFIAPLAAAFARKQVSASALAQGAGRHSRDQIEERLLEVMRAVAFQLGDGPYFFGPQPHVIDASVYAFLSAALDSPFPSRAKAALSNDKNALAYAARIKETYFA